MPRAETVMYIWGETRQNCLGRLRSAQIFGLGTSVQVAVWGDLGLAFFWRFWAQCGLFLVENFLFLLQTIVIIEQMHL